MSEPQFALAILALVRTAAAVAMFDLFRRLRRPSVAPVSAGLALYAISPLLTLVFGGSSYDPRTVVLESVATALVVVGVVAHFRTVSGRITVAVAVVTGAVTLIGWLALPRDERILDLAFLGAMLVLAGVLVWNRASFSRAAGNSYFWGLVICAVAALMYGTHLILGDAPLEVYVDQFLRITISSAQGLFLLNLEFNIAYTELNHSEARYRTLFDAAGDSILVSDFAGNIIDANSGASELLGYPHGELRGMKLSDIDDKSSAELVAERMEAIHREGQAVFESTQVRKDGSPVPVEVNAVRIEWEGRSAILGIVRDLSERKRSEQLIAQMAYYDALTGLANRSLFNDRLAQAVAHSQRSGEGFALLFIDLDHFKVVNDTLGHPAGDRLLAAVGERLRELVREGDTVARVGGDEYTLLLPDTGSEAAAAQVAWKVLEALQAPFSLDVEHDVHATASIGIALGTGGDETPEMLVRNADIAMFRAKDRGRNMYQFYDPQMNATAVERFEMKNELRLAQEHGELELRFQPQVRVSDRRIMGAEALLRWRNPGRGDVEPSQFIPLAEESGLIVPIGQWVILEACCIAGKWHQAGFGDVRVAVNLSARQLVEDDLPAFVSETLSECGIPASCLELEITESVAMQHAGSLLASLERLSEMGVRIAIDDFGTGYSSLDRLKHLPITTLKVAQQFVDDLDDSVDASAIARTIVVLGQSLGLNVVAEGVETQQQFDFLSSLGCDEMQGFLFSPPITAEQFRLLLAEQSA